MKLMLINDNTNINLKLKIRELYYGSVSFVNGVANITILNNVRIAGYAQYYFSSGINRILTWKYDYSGNLYLITTDSLTETIQIQIFGLLY